MSLHRPERVHRQYSRLLRAGAAPDSGAWIMTFGPIGRCSGMPTACLRSEGGAASICILSPTLIHLCACVMWAAAGVRS